MEKIAIGVEHEIELTSSVKLDTCTGDFVIVTDDIYYHLPLKRIREHKYSFNIPVHIKHLTGNTVDYKVYVYFDNARYKVDEGKIFLMSAEEFTDVKIINKSPKVSAEKQAETEVVKPVEANSTKEVAKVTKEEAPISIIGADVELLKEAEIPKAPTVGLSFLKNLVTDEQKKAKMNREVQELLDQLKNR